MNKLEPITFAGMEVFAAMNINQTIQMRYDKKIDDDMLILAPVIFFAKNIQIADYMLWFTGLHPECGIIFYIHIDGGKNYRPLIRVVTKNKESFPNFYQN